MTDFSGLPQVEIHGRMYFEDTSCIGKTLTPVVEADRPTIGGSHPELTIMPEAVNSAVLGFEIGVPREVYEAMRGEG